MEGEGTIRVEDRCVLFSKCNLLMRAQRVQTRASMKVYRLANVFSMASAFWWYRQAGHELKAHGVKEERGLTIQSLVVA